MDVACSQLHARLFRPINRLRRLRLFVSLWLVLSLMSAQPAQANGELDPRLNEQVIQIPLADGKKLVATVFKPDGKGPFPLVVINHGKSLGDPKKQPRYRPFSAATVFVSRGYAVIAPMREGFGESDGKFSLGDCSTLKDGYRQARSIKHTLDHIRKQPWADTSRILLAGQSHGGLASVAFLAAYPEYEGIKGAINFSGGLRARACAWQQEMEEAFADYGKKAKRPSLWFYAENDSFFSQELVQASYRAYTSAGGQATLVEPGPFKKDGHQLFGDPQGVSIWWPPTQRFLETFGLPTKATDRSFARKDLALREQLKSSYMEQFGPIPERCANVMDAYFKANYPKYFVVSDKGNCTASWGPQAKTQSIKTCQEKNQTGCRYLN